MPKIDVKGAKGRLYIQSGERKGSAEYDSGVKKDEVNRYKGIGTKASNSKRQEDDDAYVTKLDKKINASKVVRLKIYLIKLATCP